MICVVEWKRSFCALKPLQIRFIGVKYHEYSIFMSNLCGQPILIFFS